MKKKYLKLICFYVLISFSLILIFLILVISTSPNIITLNYNVPFKNSLNVLAPQGWAFFTKDVHKDYFNIYKLENENIQLIELKSAVFSQYFGIKRDNRLINHKIGAILKEVNVGLWYHYKGEIKNIPLDSLSKVSIKAKEPMIYGNFIIEQGTPTPYDWYKSKLKFNRTMNYIQLEIKR